MPLVKKKLMNRVIFIILFGLFSASRILFAETGQPFRSPDICPVPSSCEISPTEYYPLARIEISCPDNSSEKWAQKHLRQWYGKFAPKVSMSVAKNDIQGSEAYDLIVDEKSVQIKAQTLQGVRYALYSLRQIVIPRRGTQKVEGWIVPKTKVHDSPSIAFRGIHICWFHEREPWEIERMIRLAAYYKLNYAVIESWGAFRSDVAPWLSWPDGTMTKKEVSRLKKVADDLGITLIPQINVAGHATMSRGGPGKHAALDLNPQYQPLFEPDSWNWCMSNPEAKKLLSSLIEELMDAFGNPPYFHIGGDEAHAPSCPDCIEESFSKLYINQIKSMCDVVRSRGARPMMWHDMLLRRGDARWKGFKANGIAEIADGIGELSSDIVICDWYYEDAKEAYPTLDYFRGLGFTTLSCPWVNTGGIKSLAMNAKEGKADGLLGTVWYKDYGKDLVSFYLHFCNAAWNPGAKWKRNQVKLHLRHVGWDMKNKDPKHTGTYYYELQNETFYETAN